jgi:hypothetical protein
VGFLLGFLLRSSPRQGLAGEAGGLLERIKSGSEAAQEAAREFSSGGVELEPIQLPSSPPLADHPEAAGPSARRAARRPPRTSGRRLEEG